MRVREKTACDREDWAFISVSCVRRIELPCRRRLEETFWKSNKLRGERENVPHHFGSSFYGDFAQATPDDMTVLVLANLDLAAEARSIVSKKVVEVLVI